MHLHQKYRPRTLDDVVGQDAVVKSLRQALDSKRGHSFLFTGPAGTGKTTLGRIIAWHVGCDPANLLEVDAATNTGVDAMRGVTDSARFMAIGKSPVRVIIVDEVHMLSKAAWNSLLKPIEEPPEFVYWVLATTEPTKIPKTIVTRCLRYELRPIPMNTIAEYLAKVARLEGILTSDDVLQLIAEKADGSMRWALTALEQADGITKRKVAAKLLRQVESNEDTDVINLCRLLAGPVYGRPASPWPAIMEAAKPLEDQNAEGVRIVVMHYFTKVLSGAKNNDAAQTAASVLSNFTDPYPQGATFAHLSLSLAGAVLS